MLGDGRRYPDRTILEAEICIVGAGAAGLTVAKRFTETNQTVLVLESGGMTFERAAQRLSRGASVGMLYDPLDLCRVRQFGGTTGRTGWGGWCKPLADSDFEVRSWVPLSGWPIDRQTLAPYYRRAARTCGLTPERNPDIEADGGLPFQHARVATEACLLSRSPWLADSLIDRFRASKNVTVVTHATATNIELDAESLRVERIDAASAPDKKLTVLARYFVLAAGGIETPRLMLLSNGRAAGGVGNGHDLVGRYFMEHPYVNWGRLSVPRNQSDIFHLYEPRVAEQRRSAGEATHSTGEVVAAGVTLHPSVQAEEHILASRTWLKATGPHGYGTSAEELQDLSFWLRKGRFPSDILRRLRAISRHPYDATAALCGRIRPARGALKHYRFMTIMEQEPERCSRVTLDSQRDELGLRRPKLDWRVGPLVARTLSRTQQILTEELRALGYDCSIERRRRERDDGPFRWVRHHMGTTRMSDDPRSGVVDRNCQVHGVRNLFVAGSGVFPTGGNDMPTLTIVALAHRLAEFLQTLA